LMPPLATVIPYAARAKPSMTFSNTNMPPKFDVPYIELDGDGPLI
jgi:hypothetical protein